MINHLSIHFLATLLVAGYLVWKYHNLRLALVCFITGILIDFDHLFDYFFWAGWRFNLWEFLKPPLYVLTTNKVFIFFHGWEYLLLLFLIGRKIEKRLPGIVIALLLPYLFHLLIDQISSVDTASSYFFLYRLWHGFSLSAFNRFFH